MARRTHITIGSLHGTTNRLRARRLASVHPLFLGATNPNFIAPSAADVTANPISDNLSNAAYALQNYLDGNGIPSEHDSVQVVGAFQAQWNADAISNSHGASSKLSVDAGYGDNTAAALDLITGEAPRPNYGPAGSVLTGSAVQPFSTKPAPGPGPPHVTPETEGSFWPVVLVGAIVLGAAKAPPGITVKAVPVPADRDEGTLAIAAAPGAAPARGERYCGLCCR